jgi:hypothetical protein
MLHAPRVTMFRWGSGALVVLMILAAVSAIAIDRTPKAPSPSGSQRTDYTLRNQRVEGMSQTQQSEREQSAYNAARGRRDALERYIASCEICIFRDAALQEKARLDAADQEDRMYNAARGNREALQTYITTCTVCANRSAALAEKTRIDATTEQEERTYIAARGNKYALQSYINTCVLCARQAAAQSEIIAIEAAQPRRIGSTINICGKSVDFVIEATGVPEAYRGFLGVWTGAAWNSRVCGGLIVRRVEGDGTADVMYIYGPLPGESFPWRAQHPAATISSRKLSFTDEEGGSFIFSQTYDNTLHGFFSSRDGSNLDTILTRELSSVP